MKKVGVGGFSLLLGLSLFTAALELYAAPFTNGSFESPALAAGGTTALAVGSTALTGWTVGNGGIVSLVNGAFYGASPVGGVQQVTFNSGDGPTGGSIFQTFSTTVGQTYAVGFYIGRASLGSGTMSLRAEVTASGGQVLGSLDSAGPASPGYGPAQTFIFTATSTSSTLTFTDTSSATVAVDVVLDNVSVTPSSGCVTPPSGLVSWWPGNGSPNDLVSGNDGTLRSNAAYAAGEVGQAFSLDGVSDGVVIGNPVNLQLQNFTIEAWIKRASLTKSTFGPYHDAAIFAYSTGGYGLTIADSGRLSLTKVWNSNVGSALTVTDTNWHHVAATKSGSTVIFYVDGVADTPVTYDPGFTFTSRAAIGDNPDNPGVSFFGLIDELGIYNRALAMTEVQSIFNAGSAGKCAPPPVGPLVNGSFELPALAAGEGQVLSVGSTHM